MADPEEIKARDEKRVEQAVARSNQASWDQPHVKERPNLTRQMSAEEEMEMLRKRRKEVCFFSSVIYSIFISLRCLSQMHDQFVVGREITKRRKIEVRNQTYINLLYFIKPMKFHFRILHDYYHLSGLLVVGEGTN